MQANIKIMFENFGLALVLIALGLVFLAVRLFFGKKFVHTHLEGNKALNKKGITCVIEMERKERRKSNKHKVSERSN